MKPERMVEIAKKNGRLYQYRDPGMYFTWTEADVIAAIAEALAEEKREMAEQDAADNLAVITAVAEMNRRDPDAT